MGLQGEFPFAAGLRPLEQQGVKQGRIFRGHVLAHGGADNLFQGFFQHLRQAGIGIEDEAVAAQGGGPLIHGLHQHPVGVLRTFQGEDLLALRSGHHHRVHRSGVDGLDHFFRFRQAGMQFVNFLLEFPGSLGVIFHGFPDLRPLKKWSIAALGGVSSGSQVLLENPDKPSWAWHRLRVKQFQAKLANILNSEEVTIAGA